MKLLMINHHYYPSLGGGQEYVKLLSEGLVNKGNDVTVYTTNSLTNEDINSIQLAPPFFKRGEKIKSLKKEENINGVNIERFKVKFRLYSFNIIPEMFKLLKNKKAIKKYDVVTAYGFNLLTSVVACYYSKKYKIPFVLNGVDVLIPKTLPLSAKLLKWFYDITFAKYLIKNSKFIISFTEDHFEEYIKRGAKKSQMKTIPPPLILEDYNINISEGFKSKYGIKKGSSNSNQDDKIIFYAGRITEHKGIHHVIKKLLEIKKKIPNVKFFIAGKDYGYKKNIQELIRKNKLEDNVFFVGPFKAREKELIQFFKIADVFVLPSNMEGFGIVLIEAMACGTPCIAYNISAVREVINNGKNGFLVNDKNELRDKIIEILSNPNISKKMENYCLSYVEQYSQPSIVEKLQNIYKESQNI